MCCQSRVTSPALVLAWCWRGSNVVPPRCWHGTGTVLAWCWCGIRSSRTSQFGSQMYSVRKAGRHGGGIRWDPSPSDTIHFHLQRLPRISDTSSKLSTPRDIISEFKIFLWNQTGFICPHVGHRLCLLTSSLWRWPLLFQVR